MTLMTKDPSGNVFSIDVTFNEIKSIFHSLNLKKKLKLLFSKKRSAPKHDYHFLNEIWAAKRALADAEEHLNKKLNSISPQESVDASEVFSQTDDRQKFEGLFGIYSGGLRVTIDQLINLYYSLTEKGKKELNSYLESK